MPARIAVIEAYGLIGTCNLRWQLNAGVNILSGGNGSGKSTLLRAVAQILKNGKLSSDCVNVVDSLDVLCDGEIDPESVITNFNIAAVNIEDLARVEPHRLNLFYDILDRLFGATGKQVLRGRASGDMRFNLHTLQGGRAAIELGVSQLSSGEKLVLQLFASILINRQASVLILDEPEISLSVEWQKSLLDNILLLNEELQILVATHSPAIVMNGWVDKIFEIGNLSI